MHSGFEGNLGLQRLPDLLRDIAFKGLTGVLRLSRDKTVKSIAFESGQPINAFSSTSSERLDVRLIKEGRTTAGLVAAAARSQPDPTMLGAALVDKGIVSPDVMKKTASVLAAQIACSVFEWTEGEYKFEETEQIACPRVMEISTTELIVEGARQATANVAILDLFAPSGRLITRSQTAGDEGAPSAKLNATEGYVLSVINDLTRLSDMEVLSGLPDEHTRPAVCVLIALGLVNTVDESDGPPSPDQPEQADDGIIRGLARKRRLFETASYYEILGVDKLATMAAVNRAYQQLETMFESHRAVYAESADVQRQLEEVFSKIKAAHQILGDPAARREYDRPPGTPPAPPPSTAAERSNLQKPVPIPVTIPPGPPRPASDKPISERVQTSDSRNIVTQLPPRTPIKIPELKMPIAPPNHNPARIERGQPDTTRQTPAPSRPAAPMTRPPAVLTPEERARLKKPDNNDEQALHFYRQGLVRFERRELDAATHLFREAVRLDPSQSFYHYYLGVVLSIQSHARHEHQHHEGCHVTCKIGGALAGNPKVRYEAEQHFLRAAELDPTNAKIPLKLGELYKEAGLTKKAEHSFELALMLDGNNRVVQRELERLRAGVEEVDPVDEELEVEVK